MSKNNILIVVLLLLMLACGGYLWKQFKILNEERKDFETEKQDWERKAHTKDSTQVVTDSLLKVQSLTFNKIIQEIPKNNGNDSLHRLISKYKTVDASVNKKIIEPEALAAQLETDGFNALLKNDFKTALAKFSQAEKVSPSYHMAYEISKLLEAQKSNFDDPDKLKDIKKQIVEKYSWKAPVKLLRQLREQAKE